MKLDAQLYLLFHKDFKFLTEIELATHVSALLEQQQQVHLVLKRKQPCEIFI